MYTIEELLKNIKNERRKKGSKKIVKSSKLIKNEYKIMQ